MTTGHRSRQLLGMGALGATSMLIGLLLSPIVLSLASQEARSEPSQITLHLPDVRTLPAATVTNVRCHIRPVRLQPGEPDYGQPPVRPACDQRPNAPAGAPASTDVTYHGGPVITSAQQTFIFLNCTASCWGNPFQFVDDFFSSEFVHVLDQYMEPSVLKTSGRYTNNPTALSISGSQPHTLIDSQLQTLILSAIKSQFPSGGGGGYQRMYSIFLPQSQDLCFDGGGAGNCYCPDNDSTCLGGQWSNGDGGFCAYHSSFDSTDAVGQAIHVIYQAMPYQDVGGGCSTLNGPNGSKTDSQNDGFSHELSESISDPDINAWYRTSDGSEIADICFPPEQNPIYLNGSGYEIQSEYSNAQHNCVGPFPNQVSSHVFNGLNVQSASVWSVSLESDILWRDNGGNLAIWLMNGGQLLSGATISQVSTVWSVVGTRDFNGDGNADILWHDTSGDLAIWLMNSTTESSGVSLGNVGAQWSVVGTGDFNGDGTGDILWRDGSGDSAIWLMSNGQLSSGISLGNVGAQWSVAGTGDFNGDGTTDILWKDTSGDYAIWLMSNGQFSSGISLGNVGTAWSVVGTGDFNGDGTSDILWKDTSGDYAIWLMSNGQFSSGATIASGVSNTWSVVETGDFNDDGKSDILWLDQSGDVAIWLMNGTTLSSGINVGNVGTSWKVQAANAD